MTDSYLDLDDWMEFRVCRRDLDRVARRMGRKQEAYTLTTIVRQIVRGRLRYAPERNTTLDLGDAPAPMPIWDPGGPWQVGDWAIFATPVNRHGTGMLALSAGEVVKHSGRGVVVRIDGVRGTRVYGMAARARGDEYLDQWRRSVEDLVTMLRDRENDRSRVDYVLWKYGTGIFGAVRDALRNDTRFVVLDGGWFLKSKAVRPDSSLLEALARAILAVDHPLTVAELLRYLPSSNVGAPGLYGLALALHERPDLFSPIGPAPRARWVLGGPPPGSYVAHLAAYDPETGDVLCEPGDRLEADAVQRLWSLGLLAVVGAPR